MSPATSRSGRGERVLFDPGHHQEAARLQRAHPAWLVLYGAYSRKFWAFPTFATPPGTIVTAATPTDLAILMRQAEITAGARLPPAPPPSQDPRGAPPS
jgi:hypothetical protein